MLESLTHFIISFIQTTGYTGVFFLMGLGSALIPVPSEVTLPFAGFLVSSGKFQYLLVVLVASLGDLAGSMIGYAIGYFLEETVIVGLIKKHGKYVLLSEHDYKKASSWFNKYGGKIVVIAKLLPGLRYLISLPAGAVKMNTWKFAIYTLIGAFLWAAAMVYVGVYFGNRWETIGPLFSKFRNGILVAIVLLGLFYINHKLHLISWKFKKKN